MHLPTPLLALILALLPPPSSAIRPWHDASPWAPADQHTIFSDTDPVHLCLASVPSEIYRIPTRHESTILARRLLSLSKTGVLSTIFPQNISSSYPGAARLPRGLETTPIGLPEYIATCEEQDSLSSSNNNHSHVTHASDPTILALDVSTSTKNSVAGSNVSLTISWWDSYHLLTGREYWSPANLPRMSLTGYLEDIPLDSVLDHNIPACFLQKHRDARWSLPGDDHAAHSGRWMRIVVEQVYWIGGFGDRAYIGWFDVEEWRNITREEWEGFRLPGEDERNTVR